MKKRYGWKPDKPDIRDFMYAAPPRKLPESVDLRSKCPPVYDQGDLGSCTANAIAAAIQFDEPALMPSRLFIYYNERAIEGTIDSDSGAEIRDGIKSVSNQGSPPESDWPYAIKKFSKKPPAKAYADALKHKSIEYQRLALDHAQIKGCLADGFPVVIGVTLYDSFESDAVAKSGMVPMPKRKESVAGGHAMLVVGYSDHINRYLVRNSWSADWGIGGYCWFPYSYLVNDNLAADFWTIRKVA